jgi:hypothetical protein
VSVQVVLSGDDQQEISRTTANMLSLLAGRTFTIRYVGKAREYNDWDGASPDYCAVLEIERS